MTFIPNITGIVDSNNSTSTPLNNAGVWTGTSTDVSKYSTLNITLYTDQTSATNGCVIQFSTDNSNWVTYNTFTGIASQTTYKTIQCSGQYFRMSYTNGSVTQTSFRLQTILSFAPLVVNQPQKLAFSLTASGQTAYIDMVGYNGFGIIVSSIGGAGNILVAETSLDGGANWTQTEVFNITNNNTLIQISTTGSYTIYFDPGTIGIRIRCSTYVSGTISGTISSSTSISTPIIIRGVIDQNNSTTTLLGSNSVYTGIGTDVSGFASVDIACTSNVSSAILGLAVQFSQDNSTWATFYTYNVYANSPLYRTVDTPSQYYRIVYTNGSIAQASFNLQTLLQISNPIIPPTQKQAFTFTAAAANNAVYSNSTMITVGVAGYNGFAIAITSLTSGNIVTPEVSGDGGTTWYNVPVISYTTNNSTSVISLTTADTYYVSIPGGCTSVRLRCSTFVSGNITGTISASAIIPNFTNTRSYINVLSALNSITSPTSNITAGSTFTGVFEPDLLWQGASMTIFCDQPLTIYFDQSADGITAHSTDTSTYNANSTGEDASRLFNLVSNFHRVRITNNGASTTTTLFIQTYTTPNWVPIPGRSLTQGGNGKVAVPEKNTYSAVFNGTPITSLTFTLKGSATRLVKVTKIGCSISASASVSDVSLVKYSAVSGGTPATLTITPYDSNFATASAVAQNWSVTPTTQTAVGTISAIKYLQSAGTSNTYNINQIILEYGNSHRGASAIALRGVSQWVGITISALGSTPTADIFIEWTEE